MLTPEIILARREKLEKLLVQSGLDALVLNPGPSLTYLTGLHFHLIERPVLLIFAPGRTPSLVLPELETPKLETLPFDINAFPYGENPIEWAKAFSGAVEASGTGGKRVGVEPGQMRLLEMSFLEAAADSLIAIPADDVVAGLRMYKDPIEADAMRQAAQVAQRALEQTLPLVKTGMDERELAGELVVQLLRQGSHPKIPFSPIVAGGPNSANPHATPTTRKIQNGDLLLFDWGAAVEDYNSDITRTFAIGDVEPELEKIAGVVLEANRAARETAAPGVSMKAVDQAAREVITGAGYGPYFTHRTGHGLGMEAHEAPFIRGDNEQLLEVGMTFTIEPGIYLPGRGGVRIEDDVLVTESGLESFTNMERSLVRL